MKTVRPLLFIAVSFCLTSCAYLITESDFKNESTNVSPQETSAKSCRVFSVDRKISIIPLGISEIAGAGPLILPIPWNLSKKISSIRFVLEQMDKDSVGILPDTLRKDLWKLKVQGQTFQAQKIEQDIGTPKIASIVFEFPNQQLDQFEVSFAGKSPMVTKYCHTRRIGYAPFALVPVTTGPKCE